MNGYADLLAEANRRRDAEARAEVAEQRLEAVAAYVATARHGATRWADPLPVPEWVLALEAILELGK